MPTLPESIAPGSSGHVSHHETLHIALDDIIDEGFYPMGGLTGTFAARPAAAAANKHFIYYATDSGIFYFSDGTTWQTSAEAAFGAPSGGIDIGDANAAGVAATKARSDHGHAFTAPGAGYPVDVADAEADGAATTPARSDHGHALGARSGFEAYRATTQSISNAVDTTVLFATVVEDTHAQYVAGTGLFQVGATRAGLYQVTAGIRWASDIDGLRLVTIYLNGTSIAVASQRHMLGTNAAGAVAWMSQVSRLIRLAVGDTLRVRALHTAGAALNVGDVTHRDTFFSAYRIGA